MTDEINKANGQTEAPESFPSELLAQPVEARLEYFEQRCLISHPRLQEALETIIQAVTPPGEGASTRRPGTMVLVIGPSRVGKTTLIHMLEEHLLAVSSPLPVSLSQGLARTVSTGLSITGRSCVLCMIHLSMGRRRGYEPENCEKPWKRH